MYFNNRGSYSSDRIADGNRSMRVAAGVKNNTVITESYPLNFVDQFSFYITLKIRDLLGSVFILKVFKKCFKGFVTVDIYFTFTKKI